MGVLDSERVSGRALFSPNDIMLKPSKKKHLRQTCRQLHGMMGTLATQRLCTPRMCKMALRAGCVNRMKSST